jgi:hypothetical protein
MPTAIAVTRISTAVKAAEAHYTARKFDLDAMIESRDRLTRAIDALTVELADLKDAIMDLGTETTVEVFKPVVTQVDAPLVLETFVPKTSTDIPVEVIANVGP